MNLKKGYTLMELMVAMVISGVVLGALFFFLRGTQQGVGVIEHSAGATEARQAASRLEVLLANTGYMGNSFPGTWQPVLEAGEDTFSFVSNIIEPEMYGPEDTLTVSNSNGTVTVTDASGSMFMQPVQGTVSFRYFDGSAVEVTDPALVRRIEFTLVSREGAQVSASVSPLNLAVAQDTERLRDVFNSYDDGGSRYEHVVFLEDFENIPPFAFEDHMEAGDVWVPVITEYFEDPVTWNSNWTEWIEDDGYGRTSRWTDSEAYEGLSCLALDCSKTGMSTQMAIWSVDLSDYSWNDDLRLHFHWKEFNDILDPEDGVFLPVWVPDNQTEILSEDFTDYRNGFVPRGWTFWCNDYGRVEVLADYPTDGNYLNIDSRRYGFTGKSRVMATMDLSSYAGSEDLTLSFSLCSRGSPNSAFVGLLGAGGISGTPVAQHNLNPDALPAGTWTDVTIDLDQLIPTGYDLSATKLVFAQEGTLPTSGQNFHGGISIDDVIVENGTEGYWDMSNRILAAPEDFNSWTEATVDLDQAAMNAGVPFSSDFLIGFSQRGSLPIDARGIAVDQIAVEEIGWGIDGWTHDTWSGYAVDEWEPADHSAYSGSWCFATAGSGNYQNTPTRAWLQSPVIDLTSYAEGERMAIAFFHRYSFGTSGDGCNVKISNNNGETWDLLVPYWGYYTASVPALNNEPGWTGATGGSLWNFCVIDITDYAGEEVRLRFNYGTMGSSSNSGWEVDYTRSKPGADWPQIIWDMTTYDMADWNAYYTSWSSPDDWDPTTTPDGSKWAGNDMMYNYDWGGRWWNLRYENNQHNALVTPPDSLQHGQ